ncbi:MAG: hypothetical protein SGPRY_005051 [Prymnesium sp.]
MASARFSERAFAGPSSVHSHCVTVLQMHTAHAGDGRRSMQSGRAAAAARAVRRVGRGLLLGGASSVAAGEAQSSSKQRWRDEIIPPG